MVNVRGIELSGERAAINPARDSAGQTESAGTEAKKSKSSTRGRRTIPLKRDSPGSRRCRFAPRAHFRFASAQERNNRL